MGSGRAGAGRYRRAGGARPARSRLLRRDRAGRNPSRVGTGSSPRPGRRCVDRPRIGAGPTRFCSLAAALQARSRRARVVSEREAKRYLASQPVSLSPLPPRDRAARAGLERLGVCDSRRCREARCRRGRRPLRRAGNARAAVWRSGMTRQLRVRRVEDRVERVDGPRGRELRAAARNARSASSSTGCWLGRSAGAARSARWFSRRV